MSNGQVKQRKTGQAAQIGARSTNELLQARDGGFDESSSKWYRITGKHGGATKRALFFGFLMEVVAVMILGTVTALASFHAGPTTSITTGVLFGVIVGFTYYLVCKLPHDDNLPRHANPGVTVGYMCTNDVGVLGVIYYLFAQVLGALAAGGVVGAILSQQDAGCPIPAIGCNIARATVPLAVTTNGAYGFGLTLVSVCCMEIFFGAIIVCVQLMSQYLNTNESKRRSNYHHAVRNAAIATAFFMAVGYPFQVYSYNGATYLAGIFSGLPGLTTFHARWFSTLTALAGITGTASDLLPNSVWGPEGGVPWALYYFGSIGSGVAGGLFACILMYIGFTDMSNRRSEREQDFRKGRFRNRYLENELDEPLLQAAQTTNTSVADLISPFQGNGVATSVL